MFEYRSLYFDDPPQANRALDLWLPSETNRHVSLFFVHGGGWRMGNRGQMHAIMNAFRSEGFPCLSVDYRLSKATTIEDQLEDVRLGLAIARERLEAAGLPPRIALYGSSAGGHLALLAGLAAPGACGEKVPPGEAPEIAGIVASCAAITFELWEDIFPEIAGSMERAVGEPYQDNPERYRRLSPVHHAGAGAPPLHLMLGECEHLFPNEQAYAWVQHLSSLGNRAEAHSYRLAEHGFFYDVTRNAQKAAFKKMLAFLETL